MSAWLTQAENGSRRCPNPTNEATIRSRPLVVNLARNILRARRKLGLTQAELARRAGIRVQTLNRIEEAKNPPAVATVDKIDRLSSKPKKKHARG